MICEYAYQTKDLTVPKTGFYQADTEDFKKIIKNLGNDLQTAVVKLQTGVTYIGFWKFKKFVWEKV